MKLLKNIEIKTYIILLFAIISNFAFGQATTTYDFSFKVKFEHDIPVQKIEIYYYEKPGNSFREINYRINTKNNEIELFGRNHCIIGASFPLIVFSNKKEEVYKPTNEKAEIQDLFYLITKMDSYYNDFNKELEFSLSYPSIVVSAGYIEEKLVYNVYNFLEIFPPSNISISNKMIKINRKE